MKKLIILTIILLSVVGARAAALDPEMQKLQSVVANLRKGGKKPSETPSANFRPTSYGRLWTSCASTAMPSAG